MTRSWGRLYANTRNHRKIKILRETLPNLWTYWYVLIELAIEVNDGGWIYVSEGRPYTDKELAKELGIRREDQMKNLRRTLEELDLVTSSELGVCLKGFRKRNYESDISTTRVQKYREKQKEGKKDETDARRFGNVSETPQNRTETEHKQNRSRSEQNRRKDLPPEATPPPSSNSKMTPDKLAQLWNQKAPPELARVNLPFKRAPKAMEQIKDALKRNPDNAWWCRVIERINQSLFLRGEKGWKASIDFVVGKAEEILDGKYDDGSRVCTQPGIAAWLRNSQEAEKEVVENGK
jgi:hypothetical protein